MGDLIIKGIVTGLILSVMLGPAFFLLLETSIKKGIRAALAFDVGVITSDILYITIAYVFLQQVEELAKGESNGLIRIIGGILFVVYGIITFRKKVKLLNKEERKEYFSEKEPKDYWIQYIKGFLLNLANPLVIFYWFSVMAFGHTGSKGSLSGYLMLIFLGTTLVTFLSIDVLKIVGAKKLRPFITPKLLQSLNRMTGVVLGVFGVFLIISGTVLMLELI